MIADAAGNVIISQSTLSQDAYTSIKYIPRHSKGLAAFTSKVSKVHSYLAFYPGNGNVFLASNRIGNNIYEYE